MKALSEQTHYEILEIGRDAPPEDVERAYRLARATYGEDSLATYSLFGEAEARALRDRLEVAYEVLSDAATRQHYDRTLEEAGPPAHREPAPREPAPPVRRQAEIPGLEAPPRAGSAGKEPEPASLAAAAPLRQLRRFEGFDEEDEPEGAPWDGARLRRARLARGADLEAVADITKIGASYLRFLEEERFDALPASVYVRGFVGAYARCLGLDAPAVATSYMARVQAHRAEGAGEGRRSRRAARR